MKFEGYSARIGGGKRLIKNKRFIYGSACAFHIGIREHKLDLLPHLPLGEDTMLDLIYLIVLVSTFVGLAGLAHACERL
jgi:hypothetical protein